MLQLMQNFVTDRAVVAQADQRHSLSGQRLVAQSLKGLGGFTRPIPVNGCGSGHAFQLTTILNTQAFDVIHSQPILPHQLIQADQRSRRGMFTRQLLFFFKPTAFFDTQDANQRRQRQTLEHQSGQNHHEADQNDFGPKREMAHRKPL